MKCLECSTKDIIIQCSKLCLDYGFGSLTIHATIHLLICDVDGVANVEVDWVAYKSANWST